MVNLSPNGKQLLHLGNNFNKKELILNKSYKHIIFLCYFICFIAPSIAQLKIGYVLSERIRTEFEDFKEAESQLQLEYRKVQTEFDKMVLKMDSLKQDYEVKRLMALDKGESINKSLFRWRDQYKHIKPKKLALKVN